MMRSRRCTHCGGPMVPDNILERWEESWTCGHCARTECRSFGIDKQELAEALREQNAIQPGRPPGRGRSPTRSADAPIGASTR